MENNSGILTTQLQIDAYNNFFSEFASPKASYGNLQGKVNGIVSNIFIEAVNGNAG